MWIPGSNRDWLRLFWYAIRMSFQRTEKPVKVENEKYDWKPPVRWL